MAINQSRKNGQLTKENIMTYTEFVNKYEKLIGRLISYSPDTAGHKCISSDLADLVEQHPEFEERYDNDSIVYLPQPIFCAKLNKHCTNGILSLKNSSSAK